MIKLVQGIDDLGGVIGDLPQSLLREDVRVRTRLLNRFGIVWPVRRERRVAGCLKKSTQVA
jgi:hypothetical protein